MSFVQSELSATGGQAIVVTRSSVFAKFGKSDEVVAMAAGTTSASYSTIADPVGTTGGNGQSILFGDWDRDGDLDILYQASSGFGYKENDGTGVFTNVAISASPFAGLDPNEFYAFNRGYLFAVDYDADGDTDLIDRAYGYSFRNDDGQMVSIADPVGTTSANRQSILFGDWDSDGDLDILYQASSGFGYKENDGAGVFTDIAIDSSPFAGLDPNQFYAFNTGYLFAVDYDNDGDTDLIDRAYGYSFRNDDGQMVTIADPVGTTSANRQSILFGDWDSDGDLDILYGASSGFGYKENDGAGLFTDIAIDSSPFAGLDPNQFYAFNRGYLFAVDYDNDGDTDLIDRAYGYSFEQNGAPPKILSSSPGDNGVGVSPSANIVVTFTEDVTPGSGSIQIVRASDGMVIETIVATSAQVAGLGATWTIDPGTALAEGTAYTVSIGRGAFVDSTGAILMAAASIDFVTSAAPSVLTSDGDAAFIEGANAPSTPVAVDPGLSLKDVDSPSLSSASISVTGGFAAGEDILALNTTDAIGNISASYDALNGVLTLTSEGAAATLAQWQTALRSVTYTNASDTPNTASRTITITVNDGTASSTPVARNITITAVDDLPAAANDSTNVAEDATITFDPRLNDSDADGGDITITHIADQAVNPGEFVTLESGAIVTLNVDGTITYNPNGTFDTLTEASSGGSNTSAVDKFTYTVNGGNSADVVVTVNGVISQGDEIVGGPGDNFFTVDDYDDVVTELPSEGVDTVVTGLGRTTDYTKLYTLPDNVENLKGTNPDGQGVYDNKLDNIIQMAAGADLIVITGGGEDTVNGGAGNDFVFAGEEWSVGDKVDGGADYDTVGFSGGGSYSFAAAAFTAVEQLSFYGAGATSLPVTYSVTMDDGNVGATKNLLVTFQSLGETETATFDGTAELDGTFTVIGGGGIDTITGGSGKDVLYGRDGADILNGGIGNDILVGGAGADQLTGGAGKDLYRFESEGDSNADTGIDTITGFNVGASDERIDLLAVDANALVDGNQAFTFIGEGAEFTNVAGQLRVVEEGGNWFVQGDTDGDGTADLVIQVSNGADIIWGLNNFLL